MSEQQYWRGDLLEEWKKFGVFATCEATDFEKLTLWQEWSDSFKHNQSVTWKQGGMGVMPTLPGEIPTTLSLWCDVLDGKAVLFWHATSSKCDFTMAEKWIKETFNPKISSDPMNFHIIVHRIKGT